MRSHEEVNRVLALSRTDLNHCEIARRTGIPRSTVRDWSNGLVPDRKRGRTRDGPCNWCGGTGHEAAAPPPAAYSYLLGVYLGDGCLTAQRRGVYKLRVFLDDRYPGIIAACATAMSEVIPQSRVGVQKRIGCSEVHSHSKRWVCLFPQHGPGRKHERLIQLAPWQLRIVRDQPEPLIRGLIHSDGCRFTNPVRHGNKLYRYPRYNFCNASDDIRGIFCDACDWLGIEWRQMNARNISIARRDSVERLDSFVGPKY